MLPRPGADGDSEVDGHSGHSATGTLEPGHGDIGRSTRNYGSAMLGFFSFTEITSPDAHYAYNEWHQLDHLPQQFSLDGILFGERWVCSPACQEARTVVSDRFEPCHYLTLYLMRDASVIDPFVQLGRDMHAAGRFFSERRAIASGPYRVTGQWAAARAVVSADVIVHRPSNGIYAIVGPEVDGASLVEHDGVAGAWGFEAAAADRALPAHVTLAFVAPNADPLEVAGELAPCIGRVADVTDGVLTSTDGLEWAGPLERIDPYDWDWFARLTPQ